MKYAAIILTIGLFVSSSTNAMDDKTEETQEKAKLQEMLVKKRCKTGKPAIKEIVTTVPKMVAGRMVPASVRKTQIVCI